MRVLSYASPETRIYVNSIPQKPVSLVLKIGLLLFLLATPPCLHADSIFGTIADPSGALIPGVRIEITGGDLAQPLVLSSDAVGKFSSPDLAPGTYTLRVTRDGFEPLIKTVELKGGAKLQLSLAIARQRTDVNVSGRSGNYANSDPVYRDLRTLGLGSTYHFDNVTVPLDAATWCFKKER